MQNTPQVAPANEILSAFLSHDVGADTTALKSNATDFIAKKYGTDLSAYDVHVVENSPVVCHLTLPYYEVLDTMHASQMSDSGVGDVTGGDGGLTVAIIVTVGLAIAGGAGISALIGLTIEEKLEQNADNK